MMTTRNIQSVLDKVYGDKMPDRADLEYLLKLEDPRHVQTLFEYADIVRKQHVGDGILLRGIVEYANYCRNTCLYCGLNRHNRQLQRYRLETGEIMAAVRNLVSNGLKTVVLQSGEDANLDTHWLRDLIAHIKNDFGIAVTLSVGERSFEEYRMWKAAGADRYLLKIETTDKALYESLHPQMSFDNRLRCSRHLRALGYQTGSGCLVGLRGQTIRSLAEDIIFFKKENFDMIGIGLFIPHKLTALRDEPLGSIELTLKVIALTRIVTKNTHMPATTAIGSVGRSDARLLAFRAGANVLMPNFTPQPYRMLYDIYPGKRCVGEKGEECVRCVQAIAKALGRRVCWSRGDTLKKKLTCSLTA